jgi:chromate transporter
MLKLWQLFFVFFKLGLFSFGGGYAMLPLIYQEIQKFGMMDPTEFSNLVAISQMTPGPIAVNAATYVGFKAAGVLGSAVATLAVSLPAFVIIILVAHFLQKF